VSQFGVGKDSACYVNGVNASPYVKDYDLALNADVSDNTTMGSQAVTRIGGLKDSTLAASGYYDSGTNAIMELLNSALTLSTDCIVLLWVLGEVAIGTFGFAMRSREKDFSVDMPVAQIITIDGSFEGDDDVEFVQSLHPLAAETTVTHTTALDNGASSSNGGAAYVVCTAFTGTSITILVEHSSDGVSFSTLATHTAITAGGTTERIAFAGTVNRYTRTSWSGTFTSATFSEALFRG